MPGPPVSIGCNVMLIPGASGPPDLGTITVVFPPFVTANGMPLATAGSLCMMVNSVLGFPYPVLIGPTGSSGVLVGGRPVVRLMDTIPSPPGMLLVLGPAAVPFVVDTWPP